MAEPNELISYSGKSIAKNTIYNLLGYGIPVIFALIIIPFLVRGLGVERFGILNLAWIVIGYFSFFDFGIGRGLTKIIAEKIGSNNLDQIPGVFWTSLFLMLIVSLIATIISFFFIPTLVDLFNISKNMHQEAIGTFYLLSFSIPIVATTAGLRGVLEAYQKFRTINIMRSILGIFTFLGPLIVLIKTNSLFWIVFFLIIIRIIIWAIYLLNCLRYNRNLKKEFKLDFTAIKPVLNFSIWITIANIAGPVIIYSDRFLIGLLISAKAVAYYATPYEIVTKLLIIPGALTGVLFPVFSASFLNQPQTSKKILTRGIKFIFLFIFPIVLLFVFFSYEGMMVWLGEEFAKKSAFILQCLSIGVLMNCLSSITDNFFQGIGKPRIPTLIILSELPFYLLAMWYAIEKTGIYGAALTFMLMATINCAVLYILANKIVGIKFNTKFDAFLFFFLLITLIIPFLTDILALKIIFAIGLIIFFVFLATKYYLSSDEKLFVFSKIRQIFN